MIPLGVLAGSRHIPAGGGGPLTLTYGGWVEDAANSAGYTLSGLPIGAADPTREVVVVIAHRSTAAAPAVSACTINGVPATIDIETVVTDNSARSLLAVARAAVPSGATADVAVTFSASGLRTFAAAYTLTGGAAALVGSASTSGSVATLTLTPSSSAAVVAACVFAGNTAPALTTDTTDMSQNSSESNFWLTVGSSTSEPTSITATTATGTPPAIAVAYAAA